MGSVSSIVFSPDGRNIALASIEDVVRILDAESGSHVSTLEGHENSVECIAFSPDGKYIASGSKDMKILIWNAEIGTHVSIFEGKSDKEWARSISFSPDGKCIAAGFENYSIQIWNVKTGTNPHLRDSGTLSIPFHFHQMESILLQDLKKNQSESGM